MKKDSNKFLTVALAVIGGIVVVVGLVMVFAKVFGCNCCGDDCDDEDFCDENGCYCEEESEGECKEDEGCCCGCEE